ncbi:MAG: hypothetical protein H9533_11900 [Rhodobacteraceae bacterium]|nr:hypothetical protein [Paracoccaceae bacterium]
MDLFSRGSRSALSKGIEGQSKAPALLRPRPSSKQVAVAERIARLRLRIPDECYRDRGMMMSRWIARNIM